MYLLRAQFTEYFVPFIMPPGPNQTPTVNAETLKEMLAVYPGLFQGYGEIPYGSDFSKAIDDPSSAPIFQEIYQVVRENKLAVYFHPAEGQKDNLERVLKRHPGIKFIVHGEGIEN
ncbi:MAG: hypothetical protein V3U35_07975, partial [Candidatus Neomarinimicrobiota bacterium]